MTESRRWSSSAQLFSLSVFLACLAALFPFPNEVSLFPFYPFLIPSSLQHKPNPSALLSLSCCFSKELLVSGSWAILSPLSMEKEEKIPWIYPCFSPQPLCSCPTQEKEFLGTRRSSRSLEQQSCTFWLILVNSRNFSWAFPLDSSH